MKQNIYKEQTIKDNMKNTFGYTKEEVELVNKEVEKIENE